MFALRVFGVPPFLFVVGVVFVAFSRGEWMGVLVELMASLWVGVAVSLAGRLPCGVDGTPDRVLRTHTPWTTTTSI